MFEEWVSARCLVGDKTHKTPTQDLYADYVDWSAKQPRELRPHVIDVFVRCLQSIGCTKCTIYNYDHSHRENGYRRIRLQNES